MENKPVIGILIGDPAGVGPEIIAKLLVNGFFDEICKPLIIGDFRVMERAFEVISEKSNLKAIEHVSEAKWGKEVPILHRDNADPAMIPFGEATIMGGKACIDGMNVALELYEKGEIEGFCFGPFNKSMLKKDPSMYREDGALFESEHHYIANKISHTGPFGEINAVKNVLTTRTTSHIPIKYVSINMTKGAILKAISLMHITLVNAGVTNPKIAVAALNPHAGERGTCGREEIEVIKPAILDACNKYKEDTITGPYPSDTIFVKAFNGEFDGVVTMFHDQGQIALKVIGFDEGITIAGGFDIPIVTAGHGTAYDIAGKNLVKTTAFENAVKMCVQMVKTRRNK